MTSDPDLTAAEVDAICAGLKQNAAKVRFLRGLGVHVERRPDGSPLVNRAHYEAVRSGSPVGAPVFSGLPPGVKFSRAV